MGSQKGLSMKRKIWAMLLASVIALFMLPTMAFTAEDGNWVYDETNETLVSVSQGITLSNVTVDENRGLTIGSNPDLAATTLNLAGTIADAANPSVTYSLMALGDNAFLRGAFASVSLPDTLTSLGANAFSACAGLTSITIPGSVTDIGANTFLGCSSLSSAELSSGIKQVGDSMFRQCMALSSVTLPETVTTIGAYAFDSCTALTSVDLPSSLTNIETGAFYNCAGLLSLTLPSAVSSVGANAFYNCANLSSLTILSSQPPLVGVNSFSGGTIIYVPDDSFQIYKDAVTANDNGWRGVSNTIAPLASAPATVTVTVVNGTGGGSYMPGAVVTITADSYALAGGREGHFIGWTSSDSSVVFADASALTTTFTVPSQDVTVTANYEEHDMNWTSNEDGTHSGTCSICGRNGGGTCYGGTATCSSPAICAECGGTYGAIDPSNHSTLTHVAAQSATCSTAGHTEHWHCAGCNKYFSDLFGTNEITQTDTVIPATGQHTYVEGVCSVCGALDPNFVPQISAGTNVWHQGSTEGLTFTSSAAFSTFQGLEVDGIAIDSVYYTAVEGSTVITLSPVFLSTLVLGTHDITMISGFGRTTATFEIQPAVAYASPAPEASNPASTANTTDAVASETPRTGDSAMIMWMLAWCAVVSVMSVLVARTALRKRA